MKLMLRGKYRQRYLDLAILIEDGSSVSDVCCGDCEFAKYLEKKNVKYTGLDYNQTFVDNARSRGLQADVCDPARDPIAPADYVVMQSSLYQFMPGHVSVLQSMLNAAKKYVIISECLKSYSQSSNPLLSALGRRLNNPGDGFKTLRFDFDSFQEMLKPHKAKIKKEYWASNGVDYIVLIEK